MGMVNKFQKVKPLRGAPAQAWTPLARGRGIPFGCSPGRIIKSPKFLRLTIGLYEIASPEGAGMQTDDVRPGTASMSVTVGPRRATPVGLTVPTDPDTPLGNVWVVPRAKKASFSGLLVRRGRKPASAAARPHGNPSDARDPTDTALRGLALPRASPRLITIAPTYTIPLNGHVTRSPIFNEARFREWTPFTTAIEAPLFPRAGVAHSRRSV